MIFTEQKIENINNRLDEKKKNNPYKGKVVGIGINLRNSIGGSGAFIGNWHICDIDELNRTIEELTMLKDAIEEETGIIL